MRRHLPHSPEESQTVAQSTCLVYFSCSTTHFILAIPLQFINASRKCVIRLPSPKSSQANCAPGLSFSPWMEPDTTIYGQADRQMIWAEKASWPASSHDQSLDFPFSSKVPKDDEAVDSSRSHCPSVAHLVPKSFLSCQTILYQDFGYNQFL
jgi:hypothetical protein